MESDNNINEEIEMIIIDRLNDAYQKNAEYHQAISKEREMHNKLKDELSQQQQKLWEQYFVSANETMSVRERVAYKQGARDLFHVLFKER